ncbi:hypothetical protein HBH56_042750 [Parastagonospora nodorum]|nr:hypothetical protein HBH56_042750 [Parastagonospora nodorum]KAH3933016.1 hypothetical protein HBH54_070500 [Parastagonospora nodorum]KAH3943378.1 hypothetical protein HBH53_174680 [Parastagonospora nodorum]KAH3973249.1 hypothetical protein HBH52_142660 [Parastagonospora nodorum]KAH4139631.1 hypothetical protein HBH45_093170 [Parastagonospora nodorum]
MAIVKPSTAIFPPSLQYYNDAHGHGRLYHCLSLWVVIMCPFSLSYNPTLTPCICDIPKCLAAKVAPCINDTQCEQPRARPGLHIPYLAFIDSPATPCATTLSRRPETTASHSRSALQVKASCAVQYAVTSKNMLLVTVVKVDCRLLSFVLVDGDAVYHTARLTSLVQSLTRRGVQLMPIGCQW